MGISRLLLCNPLAHLITHLKIKIDTAQKSKYVGTQSEIKREMFLMTFNLQEISHRHAYLGRIL